MPVYRLQVTMRFTDGRGGFAIDTIDIEAEDLTAAIAIAREWRPKASNMVADALMLVGPEGSVLWSLRRVEASSWPCFPAV